MKYIAHRGLLDGPDVNIENRPEQIRLAMLEGYDCEVDLWLVDGKLFLGHDFPDYRIEQSFLNDRLWIHAKNIEAFHWLASRPLRYNYFWHETDKFTLTSDEYIWTYPGNELTDKSVMVLPERIDKTLNNAILAKCYGICSDYVRTIREQRGD